MSDPAIYNEESLIYADELGITMTVNDNVKHHEKITAELSDTYRKKNHDYGDAFTKSLDKRGMVAALVRMEDKMGRLDSLVESDEQLVNDESIRDTLLDLANYAIMTAMWLENRGLDVEEVGPDYKHAGADFDGEFPEGVISVDNIKRKILETQRPFLSKIGPRFV